MTNRTDLHSWRRGVVVLAATALTLAACGDDATPTAETDGATSTTIAASGAAASSSAPTTGGGAAATGGTVPVIDPGDGGDYAPEIDPADFVDVIDNPYLPLAPGSKWVYEATSEGETEVITVEVLDERREVMGVSTVVVHDVVAVDGEVIEDTFDWYAQDVDGNVWYFGEDTTAYEDGEASTEGSWESGVDGALPGIVMQAEPQPSETGYRQEFYPGEAEDMGQVMAVDETASVPLGEFDGLVVTRDWTPLEPDVVEEKYYAADVGLVQEIKTAGGEEVTVLVEHTPGG
jgi:hypothetical protein